VARSVLVTVGIEVNETVPKNGEINESFGVYKSVCCGHEIVVGEKVAFPDCPRHPHLTTVWKLIADESIPKALELRKKRSA
jgi:hypothetical protein